MLFIFSDGRKSLECGFNSGFCIFGGYLESENKTKRRESRIKNSGYPVQNIVPLKTIWAFTGWGKDWAVHPQSSSALTYLSDFF